ncbi:hypothetical protein [Chitinophaga pinensis]|uniref:Uncharacterized protein n=1 Tax=Chitinophaga pinensis TaxID=79329 RepID=A0A5C6LM08_9BACT|nr:hypothetical protein [Chitinophaga pinensis]TWV95112.1 hypothetical protein FEF09_24900 [Chitinophaga pinensis]
MEYESGVLSWYDNHPQPIHRQKDAWQISWQAPVANTDTLPVTLYVNNVPAGKVLLTSRKRAA